MSLLIRRSASHHRDAGWGREEDRARTAAAGFDGHLVKPVDLDMLARLLGG